MLSLKCSIEIKEQDAADIITREIYDSMGNVTGYLSNEEFERERKRFEGMCFVGVRATINGKQHSIRSAIAPPEAREHLLGEAMGHLGVSISKNFR